MANNYIIVCRNKVDSYTLSIGAPVKSWVKMEQNGPTLIPIGTKGALTFCSIYEAISFWEIARNRLKADHDIVSAYISFDNTDTELEELAINGAVSLDAITEFSKTYIIALRVSHNGKINWGYLGALDRITTDRAEAYYFNSLAEVYYYWEANKSYIQSIYGRKLINADIREIKPHYIKALL